jgi:hypothetical protein
MSSVSNFISKGVNLIKGNTPPPLPAETESNNKDKKSNHNSRNSSRNSSRNQNIKPKNSVIELTNVVVDSGVGVSNNILQDVIVSKPPSRNSNANAIRTPPLIYTNNNGNNGNEPTNSLPLTESHVQQLVMLQQLQQLQQQQQPQPQPQQQPQQLSRPPSITSHHSNVSHLSQRSFNPVHYTNTLDASSLVASAEVVFTNISNNNIHPSNASNASAAYVRSNNGSQHVSRAPSVNGSTHNSVVDSSTPRVLNNIEDNTANQIIEVHEIVSVDTTQAQNVHNEDDEGCM